MRYIALLRGINVGGNNKVSMPELRKSLENIGFKNISTYINSGNVIFDAIGLDKRTLVKMCEDVIKKQFGFNIICAVITAKELKEAIAHAPSWWDIDTTSKHNAIFVIAPATAESIIKDVGETKPEYEMIAAHEPIIFWTAPLTTFSRTRYSKIVGTKAYQSVTIRNANTAKKLAELCSENNKV